MIAIGTLSPILRRFYMAKKITNAISNFMGPGSLIKSEAKSCSASQRMRYMRCLPIAGNCATWND